MINRKGYRRTRSWCNQGTRVFAWSVSETTKRLGITDAFVEIRTQYCSNTSLKYYRYTTMLDIMIMIIIHKSGSWVTC
jgi:hypothetical protein